MTLSRIGIILRTQPGRPFDKKPEIDQNSRGNSVAQNRKELRDMLSKLDSRIVSFVTNPYFRHPKVLDNELITRASRDLETIIELSRSIRKSAESLNRVLEKTQ